MRPKKSKPNIIITKDSLSDIAACFKEINNKIKMAHQIGLTSLEKPIMSYEFASPRDKTDWTFKELKEGLKIHTEYSKNSRLSNQERASHSFICLDYMNSIVQCLVKFRKKIAVIHLVVYNKF